MVNMYVCVYALYFFDIFPKPLNIYILYIVIGSYA